MDRTAGGFVRFGGYGLHQFVEEKVSGAGHAERFVSGLLSAQGNVEALNKIVAESDY